MATYLLRRCAWRTVPAATWGTAIQHQGWACPQRQSLEHATWGAAIQHQCWEMPTQIQSLQHATWGAAIQHQCWELPTQIQSLQHARFETLTVVLLMIHLLAHGPVSMHEWLLTFQRYCVPLRATEVTVTQCFKMLLTTHPITQHNTLEDFNPCCNTQLKIWYCHALIDATITLCQDVVTGKHTILHWIHQHLYLLFLTRMIQHGVQATSRCT